MEPAPSPSEGAPSEKPEERVNLEAEPLTRPEYISAIVHLYRGELHRVNAWRIRLDNTTNWAIFTTAGLLTFSFGEGKHSHWVILIGMLLVTVFLVFEARRFRLADIWRARLRKIEENFYGPILRRDLLSPESQWGHELAADLFRPHYKLTIFTALRVRFLRNYCPIYVVLLFAWGIHVLVAPGRPDLAGIKAHLATGMIPWWAPLVYVALFVACALALVFLSSPMPTSSKKYWSNVPEEGELEPPILDL